MKISLENSLIQNNMKVFNVEYGVYILCILFEIEYIIYTIRLLISLLFTTHWLILGLLYFSWLVLNSLSDAYYEIHSNELKLTILSLSWLAAFI